MRGFRGGIGIGGLLAGILSFAQNMPNFFATQPYRLPRRFQPSPPKIRKRGPASTRRGWRPFYYDVAGPKSREAERRRNQGAHFNQLRSHKPGTVQPRHIFGQEDRP